MCMHSHYAVQFSSKLEIVMYTELDACGLAVFETRMMEYRPCVKTGLLSTFDHDSTPGPYSSPGTPEHTNTNKACVCQAFHPYNNPMIYY